jgi:hypothetical protein
MNRSIDARSDLYSLGVTSKLTGLLPFATRQPVAPVNRRATPEPLSA